MSKRGKKYTPEFKAKVVLELLSGELTLNQVSSKYGVTPKSLQEWKATFMSNASLAFDLERAVSGYKADLASKEKEVNELHRQLGKRTAELEWAAKKLKSLGFEQKKRLVESKLKTVPVVRQCELLSFNRSTHYYQSMVDDNEKHELLKAIDAVYSELPFYGYRKGTPAPEVSRLRRWREPCASLYAGAGAEDHLSHQGHQNHYRQCSTPQISVFAA